MKIGHFGSCLSADPIAALVHEYGCEEVFRIHHNRSDQFVNYFIDKSADQYDYEWLTSFLKPKPENEKDALTFIENQYLPWIGYENKLRHMVEPDTNFFENLKNQKIDIIMFDNFMDIASCIFHPKNGKKEQSLFFAGHFYENQEEINDYFYMGDYLTPRESALNWLKIYKFFRAAQPDAKFIFTCWTHATSRGNEQRTERICGFYEEFKAIAENEDIMIIPPLDVDNDLTNGPDDWYHMSAKMYKALAGYIFVNVAGKLSQYK